MATYNNCYFEGTIWEPTIKTNTAGSSTWSCNLSVYKKKGTDGKNEYTKVWLRAYGPQAEENYRTWKQGDKVAVTASYRNEAYNGKYYNFFAVETIGPQPAKTNSPYAQSYARPVPQNDTRRPPQQDLFAREIPEAVPVEEELPF